MANRILHWFHRVWFVKWDSFKNTLGAGNRYCDRNRPDRFMQSLKRTVTRTKNTILLGWYHTPEMVNFSKFLWNGVYGKCNIRLFRIQSVILHSTPSFYKSISGFFLVLVCSLFRGSIVEEHHIVALRENVPHSFSVSKFIR